MSVHVVADTADKIASLHALLQERYAVTSEFLGGTGGRQSDVEAVIVAADLRSVQNIAALKELSGNISRIAEADFLVDQRARLLVGQAYALGATRCSTLLSVRRSRWPNLPISLLARSARKTPCITPRSGVRGCDRDRVDVLGRPQPRTHRRQGGRGRGSRIADSVAEDGLSSWLETVRHHHEGTYQHCLLVASMDVRFRVEPRSSRNGTSSDYPRRRCFTTSARPKIPLAILDKPGRLDEAERAMIETHPAAGWEVLKGSAGHFARRSSTQSVIITNISTAAGSPDVALRHQHRRHRSDADHFRYFFGIDRASALQPDDVSGAGL